MLLLLSFLVLLFLHWLDVHLLMMLLLVALHLRHVCLLLLPLHDLVYKHCLVDALVLETSRSFAVPLQLVLTAHRNRTGIHRDGRDSG